MIPRDGPLPNRGPVRFNDEAAVGIEPVGEAVAPELMH